MAIGTGEIFSLIILIIVAYIIFQFWRGYKEFGRARSAYKDETKMQKEEEMSMSKERIKAEMEDLKSAGDIRLTIGLIFILGGFGSIFGGGLTTIFTPSYGVPTGALLSIAVPFIIGGIVGVLIGLILLKSWREKRRRYNELKIKL